jgi:hypothetical protein
MQCSRRRAAIPGIFRSVLCSTTAAAAAGQSLVDCGSLFESWWSDGSLPPMVLASPSAGMSYYLEDAAAALRWDAFIAESFVDRLRATCDVRSDRNSTVITGMSMARS